MIARATRLFSGSSAKVAWRGVVRPATSWSHVFLGAVFILPTVFVGFPWMTVPRIVAIATLGIILSVALFHGKVPRDKIFIKLLLTFATLILYMLLLDGLRGDEEFATNVMNQGYSFVFLIFCYFLRPIDLGNPLRIWAIVLISFGLYQYFVTPITITDLIPSFGGYIGTHEGILAATGEWNYLENLRRMHGPFLTGIGFSHMLGIVAIIFYIQWRETEKRASVILFLICVFCMYFTFTRSALYGLLLVIFAYEVVCRRAVGPALFGGLLLGATVILFSDYLVGQTLVSNRLINVYDGETLTKVTTNWFLMRYTLENYPFFGFPRFEFRENVYRAFLDSGVELLYPVEFYITNHNQLIYYFKHYGLVGLFFIVLFHYYLFKLFLRMDQPYRNFGLWALVFSLQFSLLHNNFTLETPLIMVLARFPHGPNASSPARYSRRKHSVHPT